MLPELEDACARKRRKKSCRRSDSRIESARSKASSVENVLRNASAGQSRSTKQLTVPSTSLEVRSQSRKCHGNGLSSSACSIGNLVASSTETSSTTDAYFKKASNFLRLS